MVFFFTYEPWQRREFGKLKIFVQVVLAYWYYSDSIHLATNVVIFTFAINT